MRRHASSWPGGRFLVLGVLLAVLSGCGTTTTAGTALPERRPSTTSADRSDRTSAEPTTTTSAAPRFVITLSATGTASTLSLTYTVDGAVVFAGPATLPWQQDLAIPDDGSGHSWQVVAEVGGGSVQLLASVDGQPFTQSSGGGTAHVTIEGSVSAS
jgi:hypothetical protein